MLSLAESYLQNLSLPSEFVSKEIAIGDVKIGGTQPIRIQSMTNTDTLDTVSTVRQVISLADAGCEIARISTPTVKEAQNLAVIKQELIQRGYDIPLVADVHFQPKAAEKAATIVEKVRINPGNYASKNSVKTTFSEQEYRDEADMISERLFPLFSICKEYGTAVRIGVNHGSLSSRIMERYGDSPAGMVESAMEFARVCQDLGFEKLVFSLKSSNVRVMVYATRLLVAKMAQENIMFPLHLGVTEAGDGEDGRIKSAVGITSLLQDGIGDTIRVSLTEDPVKEIPYAKRIVSHFNTLGDSRIKKQIESTTHPFKYLRRSTGAVDIIGGKNPPVVVGNLATEEKPGPDFTGKGNTLNKVDGDVKLVMDSIDDKGISGSSSRIKCWPVEFADKQPTQPKFPIKDDPVILKTAVDTNNIEEFIVRNAIITGTPLIDGMIDGLWLNAGSEMEEATAIRIAFGLLQASRSRITKTEYIACPSCGRTKFDIERVLQQVRRRTAHLKGLKIAVMGCIVNGPGEMADADYGYVGAGNGRISLYKGSKVYKRNIPESQAIDALISLIKENGDWLENFS